MREGPRRHVLGALESDFRGRIVAELVHLTAGMIVVSLLVGDRHMRADDADDARVNPPRDALLEGGYLASRHVVRYDRAESWP